MRDEEIPKHFKKPVKKRFGLQMSYGFFGKKWTYTRWYTTEKARDQAMIDLPKHTCNILKDRGYTKNYRTVER